MPADRKQNSILAAALATAGLVIAALRRRPAEARHPAHRAAGGRLPLPASGREAGQGRDATRPSEIPARGWWAILKRTAQQVSEDRVMAEAAGITFYALLALFPALAALISIYGLFADPQQVERHLGTLEGLVPGGGMDILHDQVKRIAGQAGGALGFGVVIGILTSLWSANQGMKALVDALNGVYEEKETRSFLQRTLVTLAFTASGILFILLAMTAVVVVPVVLDFIGLGSVAERTLSWARWPLLLLAVGVFLAFVYRYGPNRENARWRWITWGSAFASVAWLLGSAAFSWYVASFGSYNRTYGSLGAAIGFMTWIWLSSIVVLVGAELDAEMERQTARDTTTGPERPMGQRGAKMADTVAS